MIWSKSRCFKVEITTPLKPAVAGPELALEAAARFLVVGGTRICTNKVLVPKLATSESIRLRNPAPADSTKITVAIPMTIPKVVSVVRPGLANKDLVDWRKATNILFVPQRVYRI